MHFVTKVSLHFWNLRKKTDFLIPESTIFGEKISDPYLVIPNLTRPEKGRLSAWILDYEFFQKYFWAAQAHHKQDPLRLFWYLKKSENLTVVIVHSNSSEVNNQWIKYNSECSPVSKSQLM
jgi:hypothetical protein